MYAKFQNGTISFIMSVHPSICLNRTTWLPLDGFSWNLIFEYFSKLYQENSCFIKIQQEQQVHDMKTYTYVW